MALRPRDLADRMAGRRKLDDGYLRETFTLPRDKAVATVTAPPATAVFSKQAPRIAVTVTAPGVEPTGTVTLLDHGVVIGTATLSHGSAVIVLPEKSYKRGTYTFTVAYSGDDEVQPGSAPVTLTVTNPAGK